MEGTFYEAAKRGKIEKVKEILRKNPSLNVNWKNEEDSGLRLCRLHPPGMSQH